jgi:hypothetical protein
MEQFIEWTGTRNQSSRTRSDRQTSGRHLDSFRKNNAALQSDPASEVELHVLILVRDDDRLDGPNGLMGR